MEIPLYFFLLFAVFRFKNLPSVLYSLKSLEIILASGNQVRTYFPLLTQVNTHSIFKIYFVQS